MENKEVAFKITVDVNSGTASIRNVKGQIVATKVAVEDLRKAFGNFSVSTKANAQGVVQSTKVMAKSVDDLKMKINSANQSNLALKGSMTGVSAATGSATSSVLEMGRAISDAPYGIRGVANNLSQLASNMVYTTKAAGGFVLGMKQIWSAMLGPLGILLAIQTAISALDYFYGATKKAEEGAKELGSELGGMESKIASSTAKLETYAKVYVSATEGTNEHTNALKELKELGFDPTTQAIDDFIEKQKELIVVQATSGLYKKQLEELVKAKADADKLIGEANKKIVESQQALRESGDPLSIATNKTAMDNALANVKTLTEARGNIYLNIKDKAEEYKKTLEEILELEYNKATGGKTLKGKKQGKIDFDPFGEFAPQSYYLKNFEEWYADYTEKRNALMSELGDPMDLDTESFGAKRNAIDTLSQTDLDSIQAQIEVRKSLNLEYEDLEAEQTLIRKEAQIARNEIDRLEIDNKRQMYSNIGNILQSASAIAGKETAVGKAIAVAGTTISTWSAAQKAYESQMTLTPDAPIRADIAAAAAAARGLANVKAILAVKVPKGGGAGGGATRSLPQEREFDFNLVGSTGNNQLAQSIQGKFNSPLKAYVVSTEISTQQELDNRIKATAVLGGG
jgi:hypothetical protein